ncbi:MAG: hypothetical protein QUV07_11770 [Cyanobium sp. CZS 25K]|nr:hypothetical protein [Cyanobium sp. CZS25K]
MDLPAAVALVLIFAAVFFAVAVNLCAHRLVQGIVTLGRSRYRAGDSVEGCLKINALRACKVKSVRLTLACWHTNKQSELRMSRDGWIYKKIQIIDLERLLAAGQSQSVPFALPMPQRGVMPRFAFLKEGETLYPAIWSVSADIDCTRLIVSVGTIFEAVNDQG